MEIYFKNLSEATPEKLLEDLTALGQGTEELFRTAEGRVAAQSRDKFLDGLERVKATCRRLQNQIEEDEFPNHAPRPAYAFPYGTMSIIFGLGIIAGVLAQRRTR